jgi:hypothetical protein
MDSKYREKMRRYAPLLPPPGEDVVTQCLDYIDTLHNKLSASQNEAQEMREQRDLSRGAGKAQDEREMDAGKKCGIPWIQHGCDWPDAVADEVLSLRSQLAAAQEEAREEEGQ